jgi:flav_short: flavodoxin
LLRRSQKE